MSIEEAMREANERAVRLRGRANIDWEAINATEAAIRAVGLRHGLAGELAMALWLDGKRFEPIIVGDLEESTDDGR